MQWCIMGCKTNFAIFDEKYYLFCIKLDENALSDHDNYHDEHDANQT